MSPIDYCDLLIKPRRAPEAREAPAEAPRARRHIRRRYLAVLPHGSRRALTLIALALALAAPVRADSGVSAMSQLMALSGPGTLNGGPSCCGGDPRQLMALILSLSRQSHTAAYRKMQQLKASGEKAGAELVGRNKYFHKQAKDSLDAWIDRTKRDLDAGSAKDQALLSGLEETLGAVDKFLRLAELQTGEAYRLADPITKDEAQGWLGILIREHAAAKKKGDAAALKKLQADLDALSWRAAREY